jgi:hypothetical protein
MTRNQQQKNLKDMQAQGDSNALLNDRWDIEEIKKGKFKNPRI